MLDYLQSNYEWIFSGVGSGLIFWFLGYKKGYSKAVKQKMKVGNNSTAVQVGGDMSGKITKD